MDSEGFTIVKRGFKGKKQVPQSNDDRACSSTAKIVEQISKQHKLLESSRWVDAVFPLLLNMVAGCSFVKITCLGVGGVGYSKIAQIQCAFALCLKKCFKVDEVQIFDPILVEQEERALNELGLHVSQDFLPMKEEGLELLYMPHCPAGLYHNELKKRWDVQKLKKTLIIGNSFSNYYARLPKDVAPLIHKTEEFCSEVHLPKFEQDEEIFNDTVIISFAPVNDLETKDSLLEHNDVETK